MEQVRAYHLAVFPRSRDAAEDGGNPTTIFLNADGLSSSDMQSLAGQNSHECGFVLSGGPEANSPCRYTMRYWVPNHEMEMCGHATVGAVWLMNFLGILPATDGVLISTKSGPVEARLARQEDGSVAVLVSQPTGSVDDLARERVLDTVACLGLTEDDLAPGYRVQNACTSRTKTLIPVKSRDVLSGIQPSADSVRAVCEKIGSTGLYPYVILDSGKQLVEARQFPRSSGYLEDPATGIAAAALTFGLLDSSIVSPGTTDPIRVRQGWAMGKPSEIQVQLRLEDGKVAGCWISGNVKLREKGLEGGRQS
ncbi:uncharacterized protein N7459_001428 [Penicillium hispanicum]|uniref:uncharacterized protein n=1 Tax=Penicillium hispanicum TaxID=1080232 RepID=UPI0025419FCB|nr:uncharacterized protein N7459_001428 [Penicillium hispanicum]KAJ5595220.1 hypothetical protein N7459_001428 [Penicillium hispanicum]